MTTVTIERSTLEDAAVIQNLWPAYQHDVSCVQGMLPNRHGLFGATDHVSTMAEHLESLATWWRERDDLFPYLIRADGAPAGFSLIAAGGRLPPGVPVDTVVHEFFVVHPYRGAGVAERAAVLGFEAYRGRWEVVAVPGDDRAIAFWRRTIGRHTGERFTQVEADHPWGRRVIFRFENGARRE